MRVLIVHPERHVLELLATRLRRDGIRAARTCRLVAAVVYGVQLAPDIVVVGGFDVARGIPCADLLAPCQPQLERSDCKDTDFAVLYRRHAVRRIAPIVGAVAEVAEASAVSGAWSVTRPGEEQPPSPLVLGALTPIESAPAPVRAATRDLARA
jgi:hypothetical protein